MESFLIYCKNLATQGLNKRIDRNENIEIDELGELLLIEATKHGDLVRPEKARNYISEWWDQADDIYEHQLANYNEILIKPFSDPVKYHFMMVFVGVKEILSNCPSIQSQNDKEKTLNNDFIRKLIKEIKNVDNIVIHREDITEEG